MSATNNVRLAVALSVAVAALVAVLWLTYGSGAFALALFAGWLDKLARARLAEANRQVDEQLKGLGHG